MKPSITEPIDREIKFDFAKLNLAISFWKKEADQYIDIITEVNEAKTKPLTIFPST